MLLLSSGILFLCLTIIQMKRFELPMYIAHLHSVDENRLIN